MTGVAILLLAAALAFAGARLLRLPVIPLLLVAGMGLRVLADNMGVELSPEFLAEMVQIGLAVLVFTAGIELSPHRMKGRAQPIIIVAVSQFILLGAAGLLTAIALGYDWTTAFYLGCALSASSTLVVVRHLQMRQQMFEPYGRLVLGILLLQDVFIILIMVALVRSTEGLNSSLMGVLYTIGLGVLAYGLHRGPVPWITKKVSLDDEELMLAALALLFVFCGLAWLLDLPYMVGALCTGFALSAFPMNGLVRGLLGSLSGFFLALFFISVGTFVVWTGPTALWHSAIFIVVLIVVTVVFVSIIAEAVGYSTRSSVETALLLSQTSEFSLLLAFAGMSFGQISAELFSIIAIITVSTMTLTPFLAQERVARALMKLHPRYHRGESACQKMEDHAVLLGFGRAGQANLRTIRDSGLGVIVVDDDAAVIRRLIADGIPCIQGDGSDPQLLAQAHAREARVILCNLRRSRDALEALKYVRNAPTTVIVRTFEPREAAEIEQAGGIPVRSPQATTQTFVNWFEVNCEPRETTSSPLSA
jgi:Kef-type K+ transport system membrane component KefB